MVLHNCTCRMVCAMWDGEWDVRRLDEVDSTNSSLMAQAHAGAPEGLVVVAEHQTAGRGRLDRRWESPPGTNLLASVLMRPACAPEDVHLCGGLVAVAAADACRVVAGVEPQLKWPNDLVVDGAKLAGVLAETQFVAGRLSGVVVGIGLNVSWPGPEGAGGTCLEALAPGADRLDRSALLERMLEGIRSRRARLDDDEGRRILADEIRRRCGTIGREVQVVLPSEEVTGRAVTIDETGRLVVETSSGPRALSVGDVVYLRR